MTQDFEIPEKLDYPYQETAENLIEELSDFETRVKPESVEKSEAIDIDYGWRAVLYKEKKGVLGALGKKFADLAARDSDIYRAPPTYEWELETPDGETYRRMGIDIYPEEFEGIVLGFRE